MILANRAFRRESQGQLRDEWQCEFCGAPLEHADAECCLPATPLVPESHECVVYVVAPTDEMLPLKIGYSHRLLSRVAALQTGSPVELELVGAIKATPDVELAIHTALAPSRCHGEWFSRTPRVMEAVSLICAGDMEALRNWLRGGN